MTEVASGSTDTHPDAATPTALGPALTQRGLRLVLDKTTDMAARTLRVPLNYYGDDKLTDLEYSSLLRRTPLAVLASAQIPNPNDYVVRSMLDDSLLITRDRRSEEHTSELQSRGHLVCRLLLEKKKRKDDKDVGSVSCALRATR